MSWNNLIVQLFVPADGNRARIGTAYPVARNVLLTAAHVVGDSDGQDIKAKWWHQPAGTKAVCKEVLWDGRNQDPACDVLLLGCEFPERVAAEYRVMASFRPEPHEPWASAGFAFVGDRHKKPVPLMGKTFGSGDRDEVFELQVDASAERETDWQGASGAPVFVRGSIAGVIVTCPKSFDAERFRAVPTAWLLKSEGFRSGANYSLVEGQKAELRAKAIGVLRDSAEAMNHLSERLNVTPVEDLEVWAAAIVDKHLESPEIVGQDKGLVRLAADYAACARDLKGDSGKATAGVLRDAALYVIPAALASHRAKHLELIADVGSEQFLLEASTAQFVEIGMARLHGRNARFKEPQRQQDRQPAVLQLECPPKPDEDSTGAKFKERFLKSLWQAMPELPGDRTDFTEGAHADIAAEIVEALDDRSLVGDPLHYYVFPVPPNEAERNRTLALIKELEHLLRDPDVEESRFVFVGIDEKQPGSTRRVMRHVFRLLCAAAGVEWKIDGQDRDSH